jgi:hypothetical protein
MNPAAAGKEKIHPTSTDKYTLPHALRPSAPFSAVSTVFLIGF